MSGASSTKAIKYSLIVINVIIFISGLVMLIGGSVVQGQINSQNLSRTIGGYSTQAGSIICIIFGLFVLMFSVLGLYATIKDHYRFLFIYTGFMSFIFVIQFITGVVGLSVKNSSKFNDYVSQVLKDDFKANITETRAQERDEFQRVFECCGWQKYDDYRLDDNTWHVPKSCCLDKSEDKCKENDETGKMYYGRGCNLVITDVFRRVIESACAILLVFSFVNLVSIILSIMLGRNIKNGYQYT